MSVLPQTQPGVSRPVIYPDSDGKPISDNTLQFEWIALLKWELDALLAGNPDVFVAGDLLWYPVEGDNRTRVAPDALVAFGRPKGYRGSYKQWDEGNIVPQVVFEVWSPGNSEREKREKLAFYDRFGVEEYYAYDPDRLVTDGYVRALLTDGGDLRPVRPLNGWISPRLGIRFEVTPNRPLVVYRPDETPFRDPLTIRLELDRAQAGQQQAEAQLERTEAERDRLAARLQSLGIDPDTL